MRTFKKIAGTSIFAFTVLMFINPINMMYRQVRYSLFHVMGHILVAPLGAVQFKMYLLAEILTESPIQLEDVGKCFSYIINDNWNGELANMTQGSMADKHFKI